MTSSPAILVFLLGSALKSTITVKSFLRVCTRKGGIKTNVALESKHIVHEDPIEHIQNVQHRD